MYEDQTFDVILNRMLQRIPESFDKREGSIIYDALAPAALELESMYSAIDAVLDETFADTASRQYLILRCAERGIMPIEATYAVLKGAFNVKIPDSTRFNLDDYNYTSGDLLGTGEMDDGTGEIIPVYYYELTAEESGADSNTSAGSLTPIDYVEGLYFAEVVSCEVEGIDAEDTEDLRDRYFDSFSSQAFGGNQKAYIDAVEAIVGSGNVKVVPAWKTGNPGHVKIVIRSPAGGAPSQELIDTVQEALDPVDKTGNGVGLAPVGHQVTVVGAETLTVNISATFTVASGYTFDGINDKLVSTAKTYFSKQNKNWDNSNVIIRRSQIEAALIDVDGVVDIENLTLNGEAKNIELSEYQIADVGEITEASS